MENHPGREKLELLQHGKLKGAELLETLRHLEHCDHCFQNLPPRNRGEFISRLFKDEDAPVNGSDLEN